MENFATLNVALVAEWVAFEVVISEGSKVASEESKVGDEGHKVYFERCKVGIEGNEVDR
jgi:hypothetical protein